MNHEELSELINEDLKISISSLETEWGKQALNYYKWSELLAESQRKKMEARIKLNDIEAKLDLDVRNNPKKYNLDRLTETVIKNIIITSSGYVEANLRYLDLAKNYDLLHAAVRALEHKRSALEYLKLKT
jgi:hypothetical protein